jgi:hypothetical protein
MLSFVLFVIMVRVFMLIVVAQGVISDHGKKWS